MNNQKDNVMENKNLAEESITKEIEAILKSKGQHVATGEISFSKNVDKEFVEDALKNDVLKDITPNYEEINKVQKFREYTLTGLAQYIGNEAIDQMKKDQSLNKVSGELKFGNNEELYIGVNKVRQVPEGNGGMKEVYGSMLAKVKYSIPLANLKAVKDQIKNRAIEELMKDNN
jgi:hypothetical protein